MHGKIRRRMLGKPSIVAFLIGITSPILAQQSEQIPAPKPAADASPSADPTEIVPIQRSKAPMSPQRPRSGVDRARQIDWTTLPSTYTHDSKGQRVDQYNSGEEPTVVLRNDIHRSGYRHTRSTIQAGFTSDNYHSVEQWGDSVQPYGEWRYPNRPFSTPYSQWGPQMPQVLGNSMGWMGNGGFGPIFPGQYPGLIPGPGNALGPTQDDYYPQAPIMTAPGMNTPGMNTPGFQYPQGGGHHWNNNQSGQGQGWNGNGNGWGGNNWGGNGWGTGGPRSDGSRPGGPQSYGPIPPFAAPMYQPNQMPPAGNPLGFGLQ